MVNKIRTKIAASIRISTPNAKRPRGTGDDRLERPTGYISIRAASQCSIRFDGGGRRCLLLQFAQYRALTGSQSGSPWYTQARRACFPHAGAAPLPDVDAHIAVSATSGLSRSVLAMAKPRSRKLHKKRWFLGSELSVAKATTVSSKPATSSPRLSHEGLVHVGHRCHWPGTLTRWSWAGHRELKEIGIRS